MSNLHTADITRRLNDYLGRRQPPRGFAADDRRKAEQMGAYVNTIRRYAPQGDRLNDWWGSFLSALSEVSDTWAWPTEGDVFKACKAVAKEIPRETSAVTGPDPLNVAERRITEDQPIGDNWLWGRNALLLIARVGRDAIQTRRDRHAMNLAETYGDAEARRLLLILEDRHAEAIRGQENARLARSQNHPPKTLVKNVRDLLGPGPQYVPPYLSEAAE